MDFEQQGYYFEQEQGDSGMKQDNFSQSMRLGFIRKVYGILTAQLLLTVFICVLAVNSNGFKTFLFSNFMALFIICFILQIGTSIALFCCTNLARQVPTNYILLAVFTISEALIVGVICALTDPKIVLMAAILTAGIVIALTVYAITTKTDFTMQGGLLFVCGMVLFLVGFFMMFTNNNTAHIIYCGMGAILFGLYLIYDTQLIVGGRKHELSMDDYIVGALMLYIDIIQLFLYILEILNRLRGEE